MNTIRIARETLAWFAEDYFTPEALALQWPGRNRICDSSGCRPGKDENFKTYRELEQYAPNRYAFFERLVFARYLDRKSWERAHPEEEDWPGMCEPFPPAWPGRWTGSLRCRVPRSLRPQEQP